MVTRVAMKLAQTEASDTALLCPHCKIWSRSQSMPTLLAAGGTVLVLRVLDQPSADIPPHFFFLPSDGSDATVCGGRQDERYIVIFLADEAA